ncbi:ThuA domain-containing protein [Flavicella sp.]|uniref:ThuA domain-containing protein n=1 Tax=Flavicella sp. TaxID=2957742 RepID=UPI0030159570
MEYFKNTIPFKGLFFLAFLTFENPLIQAQDYKILNFYADNGHIHKSKEIGVPLIDSLGIANNWEVVTTVDPSFFTLKNLFTFDVVIFNNTCGNKGRIFSKDQQRAFQQYIRNGGGFVGIHCAGALWNEGGEFQKWYEELVGTRLVDHPKVQSAKLIIEDNFHISTKHLPDEWVLTDEWHRFSDNPRERVNVLLSLDENSYEGDNKMHGDHPFTWCQYIDGGRSFFTSLGHTVAIYNNKNYQKLLEGGIIWAAGEPKKNESIPVQQGLLLDLNADEGVKLEDGNKVSAWENQVQINSVKLFVKQDKGRKVTGSGRPRLKLGVPKINGHNAIVFHRQELLNHQEDAFDHLTTGSGYTWFSVMSVYEQVPGKPGVNSFFGNLRNSNVDKQGQYEGFWAGLSESNQLWMGSRNALEKGLWNENNPHVLNTQPLETSKYYLVMGRMGAGTDTVKIELFVNNVVPVAQDIFPVNVDANPSKMVIGQERDAANHPGAESFDGEIARFLIYEKPLSDNEFKKVIDYLTTIYNIKS